MPSSVAIIIPTYNRARLVVRAIESVLAQSYPCSLVVVDDGSTDETPEVLTRFEANPAVRLVRHPANRGQAAARNKGLENVPDGTTYFGILDSDDRLLVDAVATLVSAFEGSVGGYSQVFGWCRDMHTGEPTGSMPYREGPLTYDDALSGRFQGEFWQLASMELLGELRFDERARGGASGVWWRMLRARPGWLVPEVVREYDRSGSDRISLRGYGSATAGPTMWAMRAGLGGPIGADMRARYPRRYAGLLAETAKWAALAGEGAVARGASREAMRIAPSPRTVLMAGLAMLPPGLVRALLSTRRAVIRSASRGRRIADRDATPR